MTDRVIDLTSDTASDPVSETGRWRRTVVVWLAGWTGFVLVMAGIISTQKRIPFQHTVRSQGLSYYTLAIASLVVWYASARMAARHWTRTQFAAAQIVLGIVLVAAWQAVNFAYLRAMVGPRAWDFVYHDTWMFQLMNAVVLYSAVVGGTLALQASGRARAHERRQHQLALLARDAELRALTAQLEPHFLLNTLNSVMALMDAQPADARRMLERLCDLFKATFDEMQEPDVALGRELALIDAYLGIEQVRFADRLRTTIDVPADLRELRVPPFLLQPIVENAIKHGIAPFSGPGSIVIRARRDEASVWIDVSDSGPGVNGHGLTGGGRGLSIAKRRLTAFAPGSRLEADRDADGRFTVRLTIPA